MSALQERIKLLQEELAAHVNEQNNRSLYVLTIVTVLALPINITAGLMGMNVGGIPLADSLHGFWIVVTLILSGTGFAACGYLINATTDSDAAPISGCMRTMQWLHDNNPNRLYRHCWCC